MLSVLFNIPPWVVYLLSVHLLAKDLECQPPPKMEHYFIFLVLGPQQVVFRSYS